MTCPVRVDFAMREAMPATLQAAEGFFADFRRRIQAPLNLANSFVAELLVREALTNAVVHGCRADPGKQVCCCLRLKARCLLIAVVDQGDGFDWRLTRARRSAFPDYSGRGIGILRKYANHVRFNGKGNGVTIIKRFC